MQLKSLVINDPKQLMFGIAPKAVNTQRRLVLGGNQVYAELNFTFPEIWWKYYPEYGLSSEIRLTPDDLNTIPDNEGDFIAMMLPLLGQRKFTLAEYVL